MRSIDRNEQIVELTLKGLGWRDIADKFGISKTTVLRVRRDNKHVLGETEFYKRVKPKVPLKEFQTRVDALSEVEKAYLAGLVDGEGSVGLYRTNKSVLVRFNLVTNTDKNLINYVESLVGGEFTYWTDKDKWNRLRCCMVQIQHRELIRVLLSALVPYMVSKKGKAKLVLDFIDQRLEQNQHRITLEQWTMVDRFRKLNGGNGKKNIGVMEYV